jgi:hypothetical protein
MLSQKPLFRWHFPFKLNISFTFWSQKPFFLEETDLGMASGKRNCGSLDRTAPASATPKTRLDDESDA